LTDSGLLNAGYSPDFFTTVKPAPAPASGSSSSASSSSPAVTSSAGTVSGSNGYNGASEGQAIVIRDAGITPEQWNKGYDPSWAAASGGIITSSAYNSIIKNATPTAPATSTSDITVGSTGDPKTDAIQQHLLDVIDGLLKNNQGIPANLQITPTLMQDFLSYAHSQADPYTQQLITNALPNINSSLTNLATKYGNDMGQLIQDFGTGLFNEQESSAGHGTAGSSLQAINEGNMVAGTNRALSTLGSQAATDLGSVARQGAAAVGSANAGGINLPSIAGGQVSLAGGSRGSSIAGGALNLNYDPNSYQVGSIYDSQSKSIQDVADAANTRYGALAIQNQGRTMADLAGQAVGSPGNSIFSNLT